MNRLLEQSWRELAHQSESANLLYPKYGITLLSILGATLPASLGTFLRFYPNGVKMDLKQSVRKGQEDFSILMVSSCLLTELIHLNYEFVFSFSCTRRRQEKEKIGSDLLQ